MGGMGAWVQSRTLEQTWSVSEGSMADEPGVSRSTGEQEEGLAPPPGVRDGGVGALGRLECESGGAVGEDLGGG